MRALLALFALLLATAAHAQAPSPAQMGITSTTTPEVLQTIDSSKTWVPLGTVRALTMTYTLTAQPRIIVRDQDQAHIPVDNDNVDYQAYLAWLDEGNAPTPYTPLKAKSNG